VSERVAIVTGANRGIGRAIAEGMARADFRTVLVSRRREDGERAMEEIASRTGNHSLEVVAADFSSLTEVRRAASEIVARHPVIRVLVNNAALARKQREESVEGIELTLAVNHVAAFELTRLLLPALTRGAPSRVVTVSSAAQRRKQVVMDDLQNVRRRYGGVRVYGETKLMNVLFTRELARRLKGTGVTANCCHPGVIGTDGLLNYFPAPLRPLVSVFSGTPERGADTPIWLAVSPHMAGATGGYYIKRRLSRPNRVAEDADLAQQFWQASEVLASRSAGSAP
jgi:NAD(P)-dependent dehydrogenase (short-subunit alcohol dehydrogenase family)